jgi:hypothetical protein
MLEYRLTFATDGDVVGDLIDFVGLEFAVFEGPEQEPDLVTWGHHLALGHAL